MVEDYENQALRKALSTPDGAGSFVSGSDDEKESESRARVQRRGRARVRELVNMTESMPVEAKCLVRWKHNP